ncbi:hypothetical protein [Rhodococcus sp. 14-2483-1-2]|uniref:hypothetical protein n=1 Tax=Rhodococcus sp. 14-2483-1-2 TaxID=2023147 RepID=UPI0011408247|nr:hypothetical protein [Rhodococcus sp. 14-2483-1-2]
MSAIDELGISMVVTLTVGVAATLVTADGSDLVAAGVTAERIASTGRRIYNVIRALESDVVVTTSAMTEIRAAGGVAARLAETIEKPLATFEIDEDGTIKTSQSSRSGSRTRGRGTSPTAATSRRRSGARSTTG